MNLLRYQSMLILHVNNGDLEIRYDFKGIGRIKDGLINIQDFCICESSYNHRFKFSITQNYTDIGFYSYLLNIRRLIQILIFQILQKFFIFQFVKLLCTFSIILSEKYQIKQAQQLIGLVLIKLIDKQFNSKELVDPQIKQNHWEHQDLQVVKIQKLNRLKNQLMNILNQQSKKSFQLYFLQ
ncbi:unnamed protein product [Paramecium sonneborni]|uniref:Uncharacterized protein n=1 Tax=Paramecium sonneborni TaxID=65129 RepID=A0A8S1RTE1_9CILI|nr:unnamed protein product [Paramecium sonneborni]